MKSKVGWLGIVGIILILLCMVPVVGFAGGKEERAQKDVLSVEEGIVPIDLQFVVAGTGGTWVIMGALISELASTRGLPGSEIAVLPGGGAGNPITVGRKKADMGIAFSSYAWAAYEGIAPYDKDGPFKDLRSIVFLNMPQSLHLFMKKDLPVNSIAEVIEKKYPLRYSPGLRGSTPDLYVLRVFAEYGVTLDDLVSWGGKVEYVGLSDAVDLLRDGQLDMFAQATSVGSSTPLELDVTGLVKLTGLEPRVIDALGRKYGLLNHVIPKGSYRTDTQTEDVRTSGDSPVLITQTDVPEDIMYSFVKLLCENSDYLTSGFADFKSFIPKEYAATDFGIPYHPGALKYYKQQGWVK
jgi:hypothetical protein